MADADGDAGELALPSSASPAAVAFAVACPLGAADRPYLRYVRSVMGHKYSALIM